MCEKKSFLCELEENVMLIPLGISFLMTLVGLFANVLGYSDAVSTFNKYSYYAYAWICCLSLGSCVRDNRHLKLALLENKYPASIRKFLETFNDLLSLALMCALFVGSFLAIRKYLGGEEVSSIVVFTYFAPVVGYGAGVLRMLQNKLRRREK